LRNRADHVIMPVNQSSSFRRFRSANYFPHSAFPQITHTLLFGRFQFFRPISSCVYLYPFCYNSLLNSVPQTKIA